MRGIPHSPHISTFRSFKASSYTATCSLKDNFEIALSKAFLPTSAHCRFNSFTVRFFFWAITENIVQRFEDIHNLFYLLFQAIGLLVKLVALWSNSFFFSSNFFILGVESILFSNVFWTLTHREHRSLGRPNAFITKPRQASSLDWVVYIF